MKGIFKIEMIAIAIIIVILIIIAAFLMFFRYRVINFYIDLFEYISYNNIPELYLSIAPEIEWKETYYKNQEKYSFCNRCSPIDDEKEECICKNKVPYIYAASYDYENGKIFPEISKKYFENEMPTFVCMNITFGKNSYITNSKKICDEKSIIEKYLVFFPLLNNEIGSMEFLFINATPKVEIEYPPLPIPGP
ncbi:MAG: hypothetical protein QXJ14_03565 [Candidatus Aenigmatarchaeota archaeon]